MFLNVDLKKLSLGTTVYSSGASAGEFKAFNVLKWKDIVEAIEKSVNAIENISDIVESIVLKHA